MTPKRLLLLLGILCSCATEAGPSPVDAADPAADDAAVANDAAVVNDAAASTDTLSCATSPCNDNLACTLDKCDAAKGCEFAPQDFECSDGNACTADKCDPKTGCINSNLADGTACTADQLDCTSDACSAGACKASIQAEFCVIAGACQASGAKSNGGCQSCNPKISQITWTHAENGSACTDDGIACSSDTCGNGTCNHAPQHSKCDDGVACSADLCDLTKGCQNPDACPWGHACDKLADACLTTGGADGKGPVQITSSSANEPNPTNPTVFRHGLQAGGQRTWITWQSDSCMEVAAGAWSVKKPARLLAMPLDPQLVAPAQKVKPQAITLPVAKFFGSSTGVCQAFAQVASDPLVPNQAWLAWLEADPSQPDPAKGCLGNGGQGGVMRLARLDGNSAQGKVDVAGEVCTYKEGTPPLFLTAGVAVLDGGASDLMNVNQRGLLSVRPNGTSLKIWSTSLSLKGKVIDDPVGSVNIGAPTDLALVRPVLVDFGGVAPASERYLSLAVIVKANVPALWAIPIASTSEDGSPVAWTSDKTVGDVFAGASAVCSLDAMVNPLGTLGIVVVLRKAGQDQVVLVTRDAAGVLKAEQVAGPESQGDCRVGIAGARITWTGSSWIPTLFETLAPTIPLQGAVKYLWANSAVKVSLPQGNVAATLDNGTAGGPNVALAWRGVARPVSSGTALTTAVEAVNASDTRSIFLWSWKP